MTAGATGEVTSRWFPSRPIKMCVMSQPTISGKRAGRVVGVVVARCGGPDLAFKHHVHTVCEEAGPPFAPRGALWPRPWCLCACERSIYSIFHPECGARKTSPLTSLLFPGFFQHTFRGLVWTTLYRPCVGGAKVGYNI